VQLISSSIIQLGLDSRISINLICIHISILLVVEVLWILVRDALAGLCGALLIYIPLVVVATDVDVTTVVVTAVDVVLLRKTVGADTRPCFGRW
jgi:hypothetical protein